MAIGERIHFFRSMRGMTQKYLGQLMGFPEKSADVRLAQYETGTRTPKADLINSLANALDVSPLALSVPDIDSELGLMHTFFALEDLYGLKIDKVNDELCIRLDSHRGNSNAFLFDFFAAWQKQAELFKNGEISKEEYDRWRYNYPKFDADSGYVKVPSQELSNALADAFKDRLKED